jgi:hypothetical protein
VLKAWRAWLIERVQGTSDGFDAGLELREVVTMDDASVSVLDTEMSCLVSDIIKGSRQVKKKFDQKLF